jgi:hypothetical protein
MCMAQSTKGQTGELLRSLCDEVWAAVLHINVVCMLPANGGGGTEMHKICPVGSRRKENNSFAGAEACCGSDRLSAIIPYTLV